MADKTLIRVFSGVCEEHKCGQQLHPLTEVQKALEIVLANRSQDIYSNSSDFVSAIKYICEKKGLEYEFFFNEQSCGKDIEPIFRSFNRAIDRLNELIED